MDIYELMNKTGLKGKESRQVLNSEEFRNKTKELLVAGKSEFDAQTEALKSLKPNLSDKIDSILQGAPIDVTATEDASKATTSTKETLSSTLVSKGEAVAKKAKDATVAAKNTLVAKAGDLGLYNSEGAPTPAEMVSSTREALSERDISVGLKRGAIAVTSAVAVLGVTAVALNVKGGDVKSIPKMIASALPPRGTLVKAGKSLVDGTLFVKMASLARGKNVAEALALGRSAGLTADEAVTGINSVFDNPVLTKKGNSFYDENGELTAEITAEGIMEV